MNPLEFSGPGFLGFFVLALVFVHVLRRVLELVLLQPSDCPDHTESSDLDPYEVAYLSGG